MASHSHGGYQLSPLFIFFPFLSLSACSTQGPKHPLNSMLYLTQVLEAQFFFLPPVQTLRCLDTWNRNKKAPITSQNIYTSQERWIRAISLPLQSGTISNASKKEESSINEGRATPGFRDVNPQHYSLFWMDMCHQQANYNYTVLLCPVRWNIHTAGISSLIFHMNKAVAPPV